MKYYIIAGEASGDLHASNLIKALQKRDPKSEFVGWGGDLMKNAGCEIVRHYKDTAIMGFVTVLMNLKKIRSNISTCCKDIQDRKPDVVILVDYGGFNLKISNFAKAHGFRTFFYISPKIWAWNTKRIKKIKRDVDEMFVIFPFEVDFYKKLGFNNVHYAGNPLVDAIESREYKNESFSEFIEKNKLPNKPIIAMLAGSRRQEVKCILPEMLKMVNEFPDYQFVLAGAPSLSKEVYEDVLNSCSKILLGTKITVVYDMTYRLVQQSQVALVTSGTATLETAVLKVPQIVCYTGEGGIIYYWIFKLVAKVKYISLVNLIMDKEIIKEFLMQKLNKENLYRELNKLLNNLSYKTQMMNNYKELAEKVGGSGASDRFAKIMIDLLSEKYKISK